VENSKIPSSDGSSKKDMLGRLVCAYGALNSATKKNAYPIPEVNDGFNKAAGKSIFTQPA